MEGAISQAHLAEDARQFPAGANQMGHERIKWVKPLCFGAVLVLRGDAHAVALSIQGLIV